MTEPPLRFSDAFGVNGEMDRHGEGGQQAQRRRQASIVVQVGVQWQADQDDILALTLSKL